MTRRKRTQFWGAHPDDDSLVREILAGHKTATVCKADEYHTATGEFDDGNMQVGDLIDVHDLRGRLRCMIRITDVYPLTFGHIPEKLWRGEACRSAEHFRAVHRRCWPHYDLTDDFALIATHFELAGPLTPLTRAHLATLFPAAQEPVAELLVRECGVNLPFCENADAAALERLRCAALKLSAGRWDKLKSAVALAKTDWRDLLMAAEFGTDVEAHLRWQPSPPPGRDARGEHGSRPRR